MMSQSVLFCYIMKLQKGGQLAVFLLSNVLRQYQAQHSRQGLLAGNETSYFSVLMQAILNAENNALIKRMIM